MAGLSRPCGPIFANPGDRIPPPPPCCKRPCEGLSLVVVARATRTWGEDGAALGPGDAGVQAMDKESPIRPLVTVKHNPKWRQARAVPHEPCVCAPS